MSENPKRPPAQVTVYPDPNPLVSVVLPLKEAERLSLGCADVICWAAGFKAGRPDDENNILGIPQIRAIRSAIDRAVDIAKGVDPAERSLPF